MQASRRQTRQAAYLQETAGKDANVGNLHALGLALEHEWDAIVIDEVEAV
jgi:hypothetical protein